MTGDELTRALDELDLTPAQAAALVERLSGQTIPRSTWSRWQRGERAVPPTLAALLALLKLLPAGQVQALAGPKPRRGRPKAF